MTAHVACCRGALPPSLPLTISFGNSIHCGGFMPCTVESAVWDLRLTAHRYALPDHPRFYHEFVNMIPVGSPLGRDK